ncbi:dual specificity protein kinase [Acanthamoeba castellanii str. Neff]|uniref:non-specific serine/threonine protein kinase n=1 Tax=Acanthamoeba castellanii (strain ATCC 30010 / Neff) TaxID=1257118 RepID=L8H5D1_ACACF|nr:dual specificity protein kinase [Acanthamoeba castellanii str. Neff]ELR19943.1 dual specificity protein kinase [Acanthamoeba castellanii str. Neff]
MRAQQPPGLQPRRPSAPTGQKLFHGPEIDDNEVKFSTKLGTGCFGTVWKGSCFQKEVAVKIPVVQNLNREQLAAFRKEVEIMSTNHHPNIILFMGACTVPGKFKIVTELMDTDLETLLHSDVSLSLYERMKMAKDAALGMNWLHHSTPTIIHRDLKTANLLIEKTANLYRVKLCDFGLSEIKPKERAWLQDPKNGAKGTPLFMPPEVMMGQPFDEKSDVYSFGIVLWEILTRKEPFAHYDDYDEFTEAVCDRHERPPIPDNCPPSLRRLMEACWHPDPRKRPNFEDVNNHLDIILIHAAIYDEQGRRFWQENFIRMEEAEWDHFVETFYKFLRIDRPEDDVTPDEVSPYLLVGTGGNLSASGEFEINAGDASQKFAEDHVPANEILNLRCLKTLLVNHDNKSGDKKGYVNVERFGNILNWFGPLIKKKDRTPFLDAIREILQEAWFHGDIETGEAQRRLNGQGAGCFLVRFSTNPSHPGCFTISKVSANGKVAHIRISHSAEGFSVNDEHTYPSLPELVEKLSKALDLRFPCPGSQYSQLFSAGGSVDLGGYVRYTGDDDYARGGRK